MKTLVIIAFSNLRSDPRVNRQIRFLSFRYRVIAVGLGNPQKSKVKFIPIIKKKKSIIGKFVSATQLLSRRYESYYWRNEQVLNCLEKLRNIPADLVLANDIDTLPLALKIARGAKVIFDAHEYFPGHSDHRVLFNVLFKEYKNYLCRSYIPKVDSMITVCEGIANQYAIDTGIKPVVLTNAPEYQEIEPALRYDYARKIRLIHHGGASPSRKIQNMIEMMKYLDSRFELDFVLVPGSEKYIQKLKNIARHDSRIRFLPPVPMQQLIKFSNQYDIGLYLLQPTSFNTQYALPNKLFEFIQARLMVAIGPSPEMARIVRAHDCGVVAHSFAPKSLADCLMELDHAKINHYKQQSHKIARLMSAEENRGKLLNVVAKVLKQ